MKSKKLELFIIDAIGPFFCECDKKQINWSKIDFTLIEEGNGLKENLCSKIKEQFQAFITKVSAIGYNALTLDDLAHLVDFSAYPTPLRHKCAAYRRFYGELFEMARQAGMKVLITTDILFFNETLEAETGSCFRKQKELMAAACRKLFDRFPDVDGIIFRIGESDSADVTSDFRSKLIINTPKQAREMIETLLPLFEKRNKLLIFRTWSVGISRIGDLIWNRHTFDAVFGGLENSNLIISLKHGESDFFRYLPLNKLFFRSEHKKIIEMQARREYEGFGEYPSFIGWEHERFQKQLVAAHNIVGMSIWCQTGGWSGFRRLTFLENSSIWNEINCYVTLKIFKENLTTEKAIQQFYNEHYPDTHWTPLLELLKRSDTVIRELLYVDDFATRKLFFRRLRVPPLLAVYWNNVIINHPIRKLLRCFIRDGEFLIRQGYDALEKIKEMQQLARPLGLPQEGLEFQYDTFEIIAVAREYYFRPFSAEIQARLLDMANAYNEKHAEPRYHILIDFTRFPIRSTHLALLLKLLFRRQRGYRRFDKIFTLRLLRWIYPIVAKRNHKILPDFVSSHAMGIDSIFK